MIHPYIHLLLVSTLRPGSLGTSKNGDRYVSPLSSKFYKISCHLIGKTLAFLLPAVEQLLKRPNVPEGISILVLSPTRELVLQVRI